MALHEVQLKGYSVRPGNLSLGTFDSYGIEQLHVTADDSWDGLDILAVFHAPNGDAKKVVVGADGMLNVPPEATAKQAGNGRIVFVGLAENVQRITVDMGYNIKPHSDIEGDNPGVPTPDVVQQILQAALNAEQNSAEANTAAQGAQTAAESAASAAQASAESASKAAAEASSAKPYAESAKASAEAARNSKNEAQQSSTEATAAKNAAQNAQAGAESSATAAAKSAKEAAASAVNLDSAANTATQKAAAASSSAAAAKASESAAASSEAASRKYANSAESAAKTAGEAAAAAAKAKTAAESAQADAAASKTAAANSEIAAKTSENAAANNAAAAKTSEDAAAKSAADADSTANSINESMKQIAANKEAVSQLKEDTSALHKRQNVLVGSETGNPASCNDAYSAPLCGLTVYGKSTQDGTPTPDAPVPIVSAGDSGNVAVKVTGKNLLNPALFQNNKYQNFDVSSNYYTISNSDAYWITGIQPCLPDTTYHLNKNIEGGCFYDKKKNVIGVAGFEFSFKTPAKCAYYCVNFSLSGVPYGTPIVATVSKPATYSPYREQLLTLPTPNGLPGIPVTSGGNYTDQNGQQWICDEVDLERGMKVQRVDKTAFDSTKTLAEQNAAILATPIETPLTPAEIAAYKALTAYAPDTVVQASDGAGIKLDYQRDVNLVVKNLEDAIASMTTT